ncbi:MAG: hypothetical protein ACYTGP_06540 [Planctomycetota bacterium]|jgi:hypothetical protein
MSLGPVRPRFSVTVPGTAAELIERLEAAVARPESRCVSRTLGSHVDITVVREDRHRWSPCIQLELRDGEEGATVDGLIGPHPNVWTLFAFINITILSAMAFGLMTGLAQLWLEQYAWAMWTLPGGVILLAAMYFASQAGQRFAAEQSRHLVRLVEETLETTLA